ncbi:GNAT family N-acetyltransferase [Sphingomonas oleivorans]|uniref:GNAT family N-acetyltransferase n=1 Tax=Sphingomonas oleivorans TaxID=1735121 RepID=A0A2T5G2G0_9SPHN|nr:GNAT family N-acetyltransferase [Sphingomonas oleivorans]PTQ13339.1 GNAT family N-acetyltransferase [Sphingomonas oleivorans]
MTPLPPGYTLSDDPAALQPEAIHAYLTRSYWAPGIPIDLVIRSIEGSHCVGVYHDGVQVGFARVISDHATFAHLADVFVLEEHQGRGLASAMLRYFHDHPRLQGLRRWTLTTLDAHSLYARHGWTPMADTGRLMERYVPDLYRRPA